VQTNYFRVHFELQKKVYNVSNSVMSCKNATEPCSLPLDFFSSEKVVLELPVRPNESLWNEEFIAVSTCEPRTALYLGCVLAVPVFILFFAFQ
jgi:peptidyl-prolyl cis-trans isomerase SDCCAG10